MQMMILLCGVRGSKAVMIQDKNWGKGGNWTMEIQKNLQVF